MPDELVAIACARHDEALAGKIEAFTPAAARATQRSGASAPIPWPRRWPLSYGRMLQMPPSRLSVFTTMTRLRLKGVERRHPTRLVSCHESDLRLWRNSLYDLAKSERQMANGSTGISRTFWLTGHSGFFEHRTSEWG
jgi:hypothetical protein